MRISKNGIDFIKQFEGLRLKSYKAVPTEAMWTIGYGHYGVGPNMTITEEQAEELLIADLLKFEARVNKYCTVYNFNQNQFDALVSFAYNIGNIDQLTANGTRNFATISMKMLEYNKCAGVPLKGLTRRREMERKLFMTPVKACDDLRPLDSIALEVINGNWGNGAERKKRLIEAGYDYKAVQTLVNAMLKGKK